MSTRRKDISMLLAARCVAATQVTDVIAFRMRPDVLEPNETLPAATYEIINSDHWGHLLGAAGEAQSRVEFNAIALTRESSNKAAYAIRDVLDGFTGRLAHDPNDPESAEYTDVYDCTIDNHYTRREPDVSGANRWRYRTVLDFVVSHSEPIPSLVLE